MLELLPLVHPFNGLFSRTTWVSWYQKGKTSRDLNEARGDWVWGGSGISWTMCKQSAPRSRQITTPTPHHWIFTGWMLFLMPNQQCQSAADVGNRSVCVCVSVCVCQCVCVSVCLCMCTKWLSQACSGPTVTATVALSACVFFAHISILVHTVYVVVL